MLWCDICSRFDCDNLCKSVEAKKSRTFKPILHSRPLKNSHFQFLPKKHGYKCFKMTIYSLNLSLF